jgi:phage shock protein E
MEMFRFLERVLRGGRMDEIRQAIGRGAVIVDVRTRSEYRDGHVAGSRNIPLDELDSALDGLPKDRPVIFCCASGVRSGTAARIAKSHGIVALNGGSWGNVDSIKTQSGN